ncbi:MAG: hypothetical protein QXX51_06025 [Candidatus Bathyarchaeia archaeon]
MPVPSALVARYFQLLVNRQFAEAERELERIKQKMHKTEWNRGYFRALYGMLLVRRSNSGNNDSYAFFAKLDLNDKAALNAYKREFLEHVKNRLHGEFDRGFFSAWADCMRILSKINITASLNANISNVKSDAEKEKTATPSQSEEYD